MGRRTKPPFRADHVGSLLRTAPLKEARAKRERGEISADALKAVEDREIAGIIKKQEEIGLQAVTDGEFRRAFWNYDFLGALDGVEAYLGERKIKFAGPEPEADDAARDGQARHVLAATRCSSISSSSKRIRASRRR